MNFWTSNCYWSKNLLFWTGNSLVSHWNKCQKSRTFYTCRLISMRHYYDTYEWGWSRQKIALVVVLLGHVKLKVFLSENFTIHSKNCSQYCLLKLKHQPQLLLQWTFAFRCFFLSQLQCVSGSFLCQLVSVFLSI